ncbi:MAG: TetR family transcriptional regulator [Pseudomonadota bacterium]
MTAPKGSDSVRDPESTRIKKTIIDAASRLFEKKGLYETSVAEIAETAGISVPVTYHYVSRKSDIMLLIMEDFTDQFEGQALAVLAALTDPKEKLARAMEIFFRIVDEQLVKVVLVYRKSRTLDKPGRDRVKAAEIRHVRIFEEILREGMEKGAFRPMDPDLVAYNVLMAGHTWALKKWHFQGKFNLNEFLKHQTEFIMAAVSA